MKVNRLNVSSRPPTASAGFSLVELSIVLVILGLLVGGVLSGQALIRASELRSVVTQHDRIFTAIQSFRDKYFGLPGDLATATQFWGAANASPSICALTPSTDQRTCDGNGDGIVYPTAYNPGGGMAYVPYEGARFWQHLANAGLIEGQYTGLPVGYFAGAGAGISPAARIGNGYWSTFNHNGSIYGYSFATDADTAHGITLGAASTAFSTALLPILKPAEVWNIDTKMDDGKPGQGKVEVYAPNGLDTCTDATGSAAVQKRWSIRITCWHPMPCNATSRSASNIDIFQRGFFGLRFLSCCR